MDLGPAFVVIGGVLSRYSLVLRGKHLIDQFRSPRACGLFMP